MLKIALILGSMPIFGLTSLAYYNTPLNTIDKVWDFKMKYGLVIPSKSLTMMVHYNENIEENIQYLTTTVIGEAARQPLHGKVSVVHVILNRYLQNINNNKYKPLKAVILQRNQFSCWLKKYNCRSIMQANSTNPSRLFLQNKIIVNEVLLSRYKRFIRKSTHYANVKLVKRLYNKDARDFYCSGYNRKIRLFTIGDHTFCK